MKNVRGFTVIEMVLAITILGIITGISVVPIRESIMRESVRGARTTTATHIARARSAASTRGCPAAVHFGSGGTVWVTTCAVNQANVVDTIGRVDNLRMRYEVEMKTDRDSVVFQPTGIMRSGAPLNVYFARSYKTDSLGVSPVGRLLW